MKQDLAGIAESLVAYAKTLGASAFEISVVEDQGFSLSVRAGEVDEQTAHRGSYVAMTAYKGQKTGSASVSSLSIDQLKHYCQQACQMASYTEEDPASGLAPKAQMATEFLDDDLHHPWDISMQDASKLALNIENHMQQYDSAIEVERVDVSTDVYHSVYANSHGFVGQKQSSSHSFYASAMVQANGAKERDDAYTVARCSTDLKDPKSLADLACQRAMARVDARSLAPKTAPILFTPRVATRIMGCYLSALKGGALYRKASFLLDQEGRPLFHPNISILEDPHIKRGFGSKSFDADGVAPQKRYLIEEGVIQGILLSHYAAQQLGRTSTGNAGGCHNICVTSPHAMPYQDLLNGMDTGLVVTELIGQGVDLVTGDVSWGAFGFWVEKGVVQYPVSEITIAGTLQEIAKGCIGLGTDLNLNGKIRVGSLLIDQMTIAGVAG